jgi:hypothetical protein
MRQIGCDQDWVAFNSLDTVIGLGDATVVDTLRVEWPSGIVQELHDVPAKQTLVLAERTDFSITAGGAGGFDVVLKGPRQQRYRVDTSSDLTTWSAMTSITITNADGSASFQYTPADGESGRFFRAVPE